MRISKDALRVSALVAAGVTSGYLWRAALDPVATGQVEAAAPVIISVEPFVHPAVTLAPPRAAKHAARKHGAAKSRRPVATVTRRVSRVSQVTRAQPISRPVTTPNQKPKPKPKPKPEPTPGGQPQPQNPGPPATTPSVAPVATTDPAVQAAVVTPPAASSPSPAGNETSKGKRKKTGNANGKGDDDARGNGSDHQGDEATSPPQTDADRNRPGWGRGDKNHDHTGPRGK